MSQLCLDSTLDINYDNLDILVAKPKKQENHGLPHPSKT